MRREPARSGDEQDWISRRWRRLLCVFSNNTGLGRSVKRAINKRARRRARDELEQHRRKPKGQAMRSCRKSRQSS